MTDPDTRRALNEVLRLNGNGQCADCQAPSPTWASINLGVFICLECSAHHRAMGTHISKVKSTTLDKWTPEMVDGMRRAGNIKANGYFEKGLPVGFARPRTSDARSQFIRDKYERGKYRNEPAPSAQPTPAVQPQPDPVPTPGTTRLASRSPGGDTDRPRRRRAPPGSAVQTAAPVPKPASNSALPVPKKSADLVDLMQFDIPMETPESTTGNGNGLIEQTQPLQPQASSFSFLSQQQTPQPELNMASMVPPQQTPATHNRLSVDAASKLQEIEQELSSTTGKLEQASLFLQDIDNMRSEMAKVKSNIVMRATSLPPLSGLNTNSVHLLLQSQQAPNLIAALRELADLLENGNDVATRLGRVNRLKDELALVCSKLDELQMKKIDGLVLGPDPPPDILERRKAASAKVSQLVNVGQNLFQRTTKIVEEG